MWNRDGLNLRYDIIKCTYMGLASSATKYSFTDEVYMVVYLFLIWYFIFRF